MGTLKQPRIPNDAYYTEEGVVESLIFHQFRKHLRTVTSSKLAPLLILDPCAGDRSMVNTLDNFLNCKTESSDIQDLVLTDKEEDLKELIKIDASRIHYWESQLYQHDWIITNPPFHRAIQILEKAHTHTREGVALLLRLSFLEPTADRAEFLQEYPPSKVIVLNPRPRFSNLKGSDSVTTCWYIWEKYRTEFSTHLVFDNQWKTRKLSGN